MNKNFNPQSSIIVRRRNENNNKKKLVISVPNSPQVIGCLVDLSHTHTHKKFISHLQIHNNDDDDILKISSLYSFWWPCMYICPLARKKNFRGKMKWKLFMAILVTKKNENIFHFLWIMWQLQCLAATRMHDASAVIFSSRLLWKKLG